MKFNMKPITKHSTTKERVYHEIKKVILNGSISSEEIFTEVQLADSLHTSRTPVREALLDLIKEGLVISVPRKGMTVRKVSESEIEQIFLLRASIESEVIKKLTESISETQIRELRHLCSLQEEAMIADDEVTFINLDQQFHVILSTFVGYQLIEQILLNLHNLSHLIGLKAVKKRNRMQEVLQEHINIISALELKNPDMAVLAMSEHLQKTKQSLK